MTIFLVKIQFLRTFCEELFFMIYFYDFEQFELGCLFSTEICRGDIENIKNERVNGRRVWGLATKSSLYSE